MTREEAKDIIDNKGYMITIRGMEEMRNEHKNLIDKIYDDVESRICINCKWGEPFEDKTYSMVNCEINNEDNPYTYGCNAFERKING